MDIQQKLTGFAMMGATWIMWLLVALSIGGIAVALERAIYLIRTSENVRKLKVQILGLLRAGDVEGAFKQADKVVKIKVVNQRVIPAPMETRGTIAVWRADGAGGIQPRRRR